MLMDRAAESRPSGGRTGRTVLLAGLGGVLLVLIAVQALAAMRGFQGPIESLARDYIGTPKSASVSWAGLALAMVGLTVRHRAIALSAAAGIDVAVAAVRYLAGGPLTVGNGATWVLTAVGVYALWKLTGESRRNALKGVGLGALLIIATKFGDAWLSVTIMVGPMVLDEYVQLADHALGSPSWYLGQFVDAIGPIGYGVLHWVYIELPVAAIAVAFYQLRNGWPSHHLVRTFLLIGLVGPLFYVLFPVVGPIFAFGPDGQGFQVSDYWPNLVPTPDLSPHPIPFDQVTPRNCMPSLHTAWALALFIHSRHGHWAVRAGGTFWLVCTLIATLGFGYHYGVDLVVGAVLTLTLESALRDPERGWGWFRIRLVAGGALTVVALLLSYRYLAVPMATAPGVAGPLVLGALLAMSLAFYATFFARQGTLLGSWGGRSALPAAPVMDDALGSPSR
ncbi:DUF5933 domain-containing protein [Rhodococcus sp. NPDC058521]|uniref:phosphatase PAP2 family protein n=1 Tax=Rhodococcus sp. NPDC058521 TaxID=3346536 RepID=UPI003668F1B4